MIPAFDYRRVTSLDDALAALDGGEAKVLAGGMSLLPLMKLRLAAPATLVDIGRLDELRDFGPTPDGGYEIGALVTYAEAMAGTQLDFARECIKGIGDVQVHNRGTVGGAIAHADPASDLPALGLALDYEIVLRSSRGERVVPLDGFFQGAFETDIAPDEILMSLRRGPLPAGASGSYQKMAHPASGYSIVGVCAIVVSDGGSISHARVAITGVGEVAYRAKGVEDALMGSDGSAPAVAAAAAHAADGQTVNSDIYADRDYRSKMAEVYTRRAIDAALGR
jgi:aerobic carbon-monoxide dehydrogenase medium subunit